MPWHVVDELVSVAFPQSPSNPFAVDFEAITAESEWQQLLLTAALIQFLKKLYCVDALFSQELFEDLKSLYELHFKLACNISGRLSTTVDS